MEEAHSLLLKNNEILRCAQNDIETFQQGKPITK
jgi:hypothetical protein